MVKALLFIFKLSLIRIIREVFLRSPLVTISALFLGTVLFIYGKIHFSLTESRFIFLLALLQMISITSLWLQKDKVSLVLLRFCNSRYSNVNIIRVHGLLQVLQSIFLSIIAFLLLLFGVLEVYTGTGEPLDTSLLIFALFLGFNGLSSVLFQAFCTKQVRKAGTKKRRFPQLFMPRLKSILSDYVSPDYFLLYLLMLCVSVYILYDFVRLLLEGSMEPHIVKNYAVVFLLLGTLSSMGILDSVEHIHWSIFVFSGLGYGFFCIRSVLFLSISSVPVWVPFFAICMTLDPVAAFLLLFCLGVNLIFMIHVSLFTMSGLLKILVSLAFVAFGSYAYYAYSLFGLLLFVPFSWIIFISRENIYDRVRW